MFIFLGFLGDSLLKICWSILQFPGFLWIHIKIFTGFLRLCSFDVDVDVDVVVSGEEDSGWDSWGGTDHR